jgi:DNA-binding MarR family transcriptional regulator
MPDPDQSTIEPRWLDDEEMAAWLRVIAVVERLPGILDSQLRQDSNLTHFEYQVLAMLSEAPERTLRMSELSLLTNATLPRLSHVVTRLEERGLVARLPVSTDRRATNAVLTNAGWETIVAAAPGHVATVRDYVLEPLTRRQVQQLSQIAAVILNRVDPSASAPHPRGR